MPSGGSGKKRHGVALAMGFIAFTLLCLGATEVANPVGFATTSNTPAVVSDVLDPAYFAHAAYVMQGVSDRDKVFALPLKGVPELAFLPITTGIDPADVTWSLEISHPGGIGAEIADDTLYIWGSNAAWAGYGAVTLTASTGGKKGSVAIPVTVFRTDKTLTNSEGTKDYFVPWSAQLDINRVLSVKEHMRKYGKEDGILDRSVQWSRWEKLEFMHAVNAGCSWLNERVFPGWTPDLQRRTVDATFHELADLHVDWIKIDPPFFMSTLESTEIEARYDYPGPSWLDSDIQYVVNEAHRRGMHVMGSMQLWPLKDGDFYGPGRQVMRPANWGDWLDSYSATFGYLADVYARAGIDAVCPGVELFNLSRELTGIPYITDGEWNDSMIRVVNETRTTYAGPITWAPCALPWVLHDDTAYSRMLPLLQAVDILGVNAYPWPLTPAEDPTVADAVAAWERVRQSVLDPLIALLAAR